MSFLKNKVVITLIVIISVLLILAGVNHVTGGTGPVGNAVRIVFFPMQKVVTGISSSVSRFTGFVWEMKGYKEQNEQLVSEMNELRKQNRGIEEYKTENERLKNLLGLKEQLTNYETLAAEVIAYGTSSWYDFIEINKGKKDGLDIHDVVITTEGIIGQITEVGTNWSKVSTIINSEHSMGVRIVRTGDIAIVSGDVLLAKDGYCKMDFIAKDASLVTGDILETSGLGGIYPSGLSVGKIREIKSDNAGAMQYAVVEPFVEFDTIHEVIVIKSEQ